MRRNSLYLCLLLFAGSATAKPETVLDLNLGIAGWMATGTVSGNTNKAYDTLSALGASNIAVRVLVDETNVFAIAKIATSLPDAQATWLSQTNLFCMEPLSGKEFKLSTNGSTIPQLAEDRGMRVRFSGHEILVSDQDHFATAEKLAGKMEESGLFQGTINPKPLVEPFLKLARQLVDQQEKGFGKAIMDGMLKTLEQSVQTVRDFPAVSITVDSGNDGLRQMNLALEFQNEGTATDILEFFNDTEDAWKNPLVSDKTLKLAGLTDTPYCKAMEQMGSTLHFNYEWPATNDQKIAKTVMQAVFGSLFSFGDRDSFPLNPEKTTPPPVLGNVDNFNATDIAQKIQDATFLEHQWNSHVRFVVDYLDFPNAGLAVAAVTNVCLMDTNGINIAKHKRPGSFSLAPARKMAYIDLHRERQDACPAKTASFSIEIEVPTKIKKHVLTKETPLIETNGTGICLIAMSNSVVGLRSKNISLRDTKIYARNKAGSYLAHSSSSRSPSSFKGTYNGIPASVEVVLPIKYEKIAINYDNLSVDNDSKLEMPTEPTNSVPTRYALEPAKVFYDPDMATIATDCMTLSTNAGWRKDRCQLEFPKQTSTAVKSMTLKSYLAGTSQLVYEGCSGGYSYSDTMFNWTLSHTNILDSASAIFGEVKGTFWTDIGSHTINVSTNPVPLVAGQEAPVVHVDWNVAWVAENRGGKVLEIQAFDASGKRLKKDNRTSSTTSARGYFFWGSPVRTTITYAQTNTSIVVPFEIELKENGLAAIPAAKKKVKPFEKLIEEAREIHKNSRQFNELLSGAYYWVGGGNEKPYAFIPLEVAQSDPAGAPIFAYEPTPYKGYYFQKIPTESKAKTPRETKSYAWEGGTFETTMGSGALLATPEIKKEPNILILWNNVYVNYNDCSGLEQVSTSSKDLNENGWIQIQ